MSYAVAAYALYRGGEDAPEVCVLCCLLGFCELIVWAAFFDTVVFA